MCTHVFGSIELSAPDPEHSKAKVQTLPESGHPGSVQSPPETDVTTEPCVSNPINIRPGKCESVNPVHGQGNKHGFGSHGVPSP